MSNDYLRLLDLAERLGNLAEMRLKAAGAPLGLQPVHARILLYLASANRYSNTPQAVADYLGLTKGTVSQSLILLAGKGLLCRSEDARDRRVVRLALTPAGEGLVARIESQGLASFRAAAQDAPAALVDDLTALLRRLQILEGRRSFGVCRTCRHHAGRADGSGHCLLTGEDLSADDAGRICREHEALPTEG